ncbi:Uncharacterized protein Adt_11573 [Abeliophyllum distichum]|uniref:Uncharacterized protein n=1 Tax=Abeliophyllum distichum TaxID=126358 RepID=A0ABD1UNB3_9LAMI
MDLEVLRLAYDIPALFILCALNFHERTDDPLEEFIAPYGLYCEAVESGGKGPKLAKDLQAMGFTNTKLGYENEALRSKEEALASVEAVLKTTIEVVTEDVQKVESRVLTDQSQRRIADAAWKRAAIAKDTIVSVNHDFDAMVLEKDK